MGKRIAPTRRDSSNGEVGDSGELPYLTVYRGSRRDSSLLTEFGHVDARKYPLGTLWVDAQIVRERQASRRKLDAVAMQVCIASILSKKAGKQFQQFIASLDRCD